MESTPLQNQDLTSFVQMMGGDKALRIEENLGQGFVRLRVAEAERRQAAQDIRCSEDVVIEMLRNARDAGARKIFLATARDGDQRIIVMLDDGSGIPQELWEAVFEARVTSKLESVHEDRWGIHGRGMALYSIHENAVEARVVDSLVGGGTSFKVVTDLTQLGERSDQSSWPAMTTGDGGEPLIERGPHNIIRACCEFALEEGERCEVYLGSAAEIVATARAYVRPHLSGADALMLADLSSLPILERFYLASDAKELAALSAAAGLGLSERTAQRIIAGTIKPVRSVLSQLLPEDARPARTQRPVDLTVDRRGLRLAKQDSEAFLALMERDFGYLSERYYLQLDGRPTLRVSNGRLSVYFDFQEDD